MAALLQERWGHHAPNASRLVYWLSRRRWRLIGLPVIAAIATMVLLMGLLGLLHDLRLIGEPLPFLVGVGVSMALATAEYLFLRRWLLIRIIRRCVRKPACFACGYCLQGVPAFNVRCRCPECGEEWPPTW